MRIENITDENIIGLPNEELHNLRIRFNDIFDRYFTDPAVRKAVDIDRQIFYEKYIILRAEMTARGMKFLWSSLLDKDISNRIFKSSMWDLDVPAMGEMAIVPEYVSVGGSFIKSPKDAEDIDIIIRDSEENRDESFELKVGRLIREQTKKEPHFVYAPKGPHSSYIPLFDLVLRAREETKKVRVKESIVAKELTPAQRKECDEETERIKENREKAEWPHKFKPAKFTHPNGHPRCLICGDEEEIGGICHKPEDLEKGVRAAFGSPGGKRNLAKTIVSYIPEHKTYVEPFVGGGAILFAKELSEVEVINDLDPEIAFAYRFIKKFSGKELKRLRTYDWMGSLNTFKKLKNLIPKDEVEKFRKFVYLKRFSYGGLGKQFNKLTDSYDLISQLCKLQKRLSNVKIFQGDWWEISKEFDSKTTFHYLDPPYPKEWPLGKPEINLENLSEKVTKLNGKFILSLDNSKENKTIFSSFYTKEVEIHRNLPEAGSPRVDIELLISNFPLKKIDIYLAKAKEDFKLILIGTGAMDSPRKDESLLVSYKGHNVLIDAGKKIRAKDLPELDAILVCDDKSRYMNDAKRIGEAFDLIPEVGEFSADDLKIIPFSVKHTKHKTYGYRIEAQGKKIIYAPEFFVFPEKEIKDADLAILEGSAWKRPIVFTGKVGGHAAVLDSWEKAKKLGVPTIFTHIGKPVEAKLDEAKELGINIANDGDIIDFKEIEKAAISLGHAFTPLKSRGGYGKYEFANIETLWTTWAQGYIPEPGVAVETKIDGFRVQIHKKGITVKILSEDAKRDLAPKLEGLAEEIESIGPDCVLDGELTIWTDAGKVDRKDMPTYLAGKGGSYEGRIDVFDCLWHGKDLHSLPWTERQEYLDKIFAAMDEKLLKRLRPTIAKTEDAFRVAIKKHSSKPHSEGAMCKVINSKYPLTGETSEWAKYKHLKEVRCRVVGKKAKKGGGFIYTCELKGGIPIGRTYSTKIDVSVGDILEVAVAEVKYDEEEDKFTWDNPIVRSKKPAGTELTTKEQAKALARLKRTKKEEGREFGNITFEVGDKGKGVAQVHIMGLSEDEIGKLKKETTRIMIARGSIEKLEVTLKGVIGDHGAHIDLRLRRGKENEWQGNEIFIGNISGLSKLSELKEGKRKLRAPWKQSRADEPKTETITGPLGWMEAGARKIDTFAPGTPGATANKWGAMIRIDSFDWEMYLADEHAKKFHLTSSKLFDGNWLFSYVPITEAGKKGPRIWMMSKLADDDHEKEETEKQRLNSPTFAYKAVYGELPPEPLRGRTDSQKKTWRGLEVDEHLKDEWLEQLNSIERIEIRSTDEGKSEERVAFVVFRMKDSENDSQAEAISESLNEMEDFYSLCDIGAEERPRIVVAGKVIYGQSGWEEWWNSLAEKIGKRVWMISKLKEEETQKDTMFKIVKIDKAKQIVGGVIYESDEVDTQGDYTDSAEIEKAMHRFMEKYATNTNRIRINHKGKKYFFPILECFQPEVDTTKGGQPLKKGSWWLMIKVTNKRIWKDIEEGKLRGFSMGGRAKA